MQSATMSATSSHTTHRRRVFLPSSHPARSPHQVTLLAGRGPPGRISFGAAACTADASSVAAAASSSGLNSGEAAAAAKVGAKVRVNASVKVYHVHRVPELDLKGLEGVVKQYAGLWKGKRVSSNLPFKVAFELPNGVEGRSGPLRFFAHLREYELEFLSQDRPSELGRVNREA